MQNTLIWCYCTAKLGVMGGLLDSCMQSVFHTAIHLRTPSLLKSTSGHRRRVGLHSPTVYSRASPHTQFEEAVLHAVDEDATTITRNIADRLNVDHKTVWRVLHEQQLHTYHPQKVQVILYSRRILHHPPTAAGGYCTVVWKSLTSHGGSFSLIKPSSPRKLFSIHTTVMCGLMKTRMFRATMSFGNDAL